MIIKNSIKQKTILKNLLAISYIAVISVSLSSCKSSPVEPNIEPGRRDYTWTIIDSITSNVVLDRVWGDSPDNIWIGGGFALNPTERLWHYDGIKLQSRNNGEMYPQCIFGFDKNNIMITSNSDIWKYNGTSWNKWFSIDMFWYSSYFYATINNVNGTRPDNLWGVGTALDQTGTVEDGIIYKDTGNGLINKYKTSAGNISFFYVYPGYDNDQCFIWGIKRRRNPTVDTSCVWEYRGNKLNSIHKGVWNNPDEGCAVNRIDNVIYITIGKKIYRYYAGKLYEYLTVNNPDFIFNVLGRNEKDLFLWSQYGLLHYNGTDIQYVYKPGYPFSIKDNIIFFENEMYFFGRNENNGKYYLVKGILPDKR